MLGSALRDGTAQRRCVFEVFARRLPDGRRYGVVAGTARLLERSPTSDLDPDEVEELLRDGVVDDAGAEYLAELPVRRRRRRLPRRRAVLPVLADADRDRHVRRVRHAGDAVLCRCSTTTRAIASAAARMVSAAAGRPIIEMGSRRTHEQAAVASARAAYLAGFASTSNLAAGRVFGVPTAGTAAHAFTCCTTTSGRRSAAQVAALGPARRCSSTPTTSPRASRSPSRWPGRARRDPHRLRRPRRAGPPGPRPAGRPRRDRHAHRRQRRPGRVRDRRAGRCARSTPTAPARRSSPARAPRRRNGLQARRRRRPAGGQALRAQGEPRRPQDRATGAHKPTGTAIEEIVVAGPHAAVSSASTSGCCSAAAARRASRVGRAADAGRVAASTCAPPW